MTTAYRSLSPEALRREYAEVSARFDALRELGLALNMARGKPGKAQLDAVSDILTILPVCPVLKSCSRSCWAAGQRNVSSAAAPR